MCYTVYISTDSDEDLSVHNSDLLFFERPGEHSHDSCAALLDLPAKWRVGSKSGCSCTLRHLHPSSVDLGFAVPVDWFPEEAEAVEATLRLYAVLSSLLATGHSVDLVDCWQEDRPESVTTTVDVDLDEVSPEAFRLFENHKFRLHKAVGK